MSRALRIIEEVSGSPHPLPVKVIARRCQINLSTAYHLIRTLCYKGYLVRLARKSLLAEHGMQPLTSNTVTEPAQIEAELGPLRPGDMVVEHGEFRDGVCCAGVAIPGNSGWALSTTVRGLTLPDGLLESLRGAAADLVGAIG